MLPDIRYLKITNIEFSAISIDAVSVLLDAEYNKETSRQSTNVNTQAMVEAAMRGYTSIVELLLDYGYDPNAIHADKDTTPLMEAVRFIRLERLR